jgi:hypothetical protein
MSKIKKIKIKTLVLKKKKKSRKQSRVPVAHTGGRDQEDRGSKAAWANSS